VILDVIDQHARYQALHPLFARAFQYLRDTDLRSVPPGRYELDGDLLHVSVDQVEGRGRERARLEAHRRYIDIQVAIDGAETIGWRPLSGCRRALPFDESRDIGFFEDAPQSWLALRPGEFAIFFPDDAHAPLADTGAVKKAIVKVLVSR
jgi:biofilm protein TabA